MACTTFMLITFSVIVAGIFSYPLDSRPENDTSKESFRPVSLPTDFGSYDPNADGYIDLEELAKVTGTTLDDARKPFMDADVDDDDQVSPAEFERAPWSLSVRDREEIASEDNDDEEEPIDDDEEVEAPVDERGADDDNEDDDEEQTPVEESDESEEEARVGESEDDSDENEDESDYAEGEGVFDNADDILVDVGKSATDDDDDDDAEKLPVEKSNDDEIKDESSVENDDELRNVDSVEDEIEEGSEVDPLLDEEEEDLLSRPQDVVQENEFVENAIY